MLVSDTLSSIVTTLEKEGHLPPSVEMTVLRQQKKKTAAQQMKNQEEETAEAERRRFSMSASPGPSSCEKDSSVGYSGTATGTATCSVVIKNTSSPEGPHATKQQQPSEIHRSTNVPLLLRLASSQGELSMSPPALKIGKGSSTPSTSIRSAVSSSTATTNRNSNNRESGSPQRRAASPLKWKQFSAKAVDDRQARLLKLTKRHCLSSASCVLLRSWTSVIPHGGCQHHELRSTSDQLQESLEKFVLKLLAAAGVVTPYAFTCALRYLQQLSWNAGMSIHPQSLHMTTVAAVLIACKCNGEDKCYKNLVAQFAKLCLCTTQELGAAERILFQLLLDGDISLMPTSEELLDFMKNTLLPQSTPCSHDITSGRHCWVGLFPGSIQPYPVGGENQEAVSLAEMCRMMPATRGSTGRVSALFAPFCEDANDRENNSCGGCEKKKKLLANPSPASLVKKSDAQKKSQNLSGFGADEEHDQPIEELPGDDAQK